MAPYPPSVNHHLSSCGSCGERACPALGCEAAPKSGTSECQLKPHRLEWGCFATQRGASPLTTTRPGHHNGESVTAGLTDPALSGHVSIPIFSETHLSSCGSCGERACPALGCEAAPKSGTSECQLKPHRLEWGCFATQRGASPLTTTSPVTTASPAHHNKARSPQQGQVTTTSPAHYKQASSPQSYFSL